MLGSFRESLQKKPWIGWAVAGLCLVAAVVVYMRSGSGEPYAPERLTEMVTIRFTDTGDELEMPRGRMEQMLRDQAGSIDPSKGIVNPRSGQPTGFLVSKGEWEETVQRINREKDAVRRNPPAQTPPKGN